MLFASAVQQSKPVIQIHIPTIFRFFSHVGHYMVLSRVPCSTQYIYNGEYYSVIKTIQ